MMMGSGFPWPMLLMPVIIGLAIVAVMVLGFGARRARAGLDRGAGVPRGVNANQATSPPPEDPMVTLRERYARGEIDLPEFERRVEGLLRSDPAEALPWRNN